MAIKVQGNIVIDDSQNIINIGVATIGSIDVNKISPDGSDFGTSNYVPVADGSGTWSWQPVTSAGAGILDGIIIKEEGSTVGTAGSITTLNFVGNNITATAVSGGAIATITASDTPTYNSLNVTGVSTFGGNVFLGDSDELTFGDGKDLFIYSNGSHGIIRTAAGSDLNYRSATHNFKNQAGNETLAVFSEDGSVSLNYDNSKKFETTGAGVTITGIATATTFYATNGTFAAGTDTATDAALIIEEEGSIYTRDGVYLRKLIEKKSDIINIGAQNTSLIDGIELKPGTTGGSVKLHAGGSGNNVKLQTTTNGIEITGTTDTDQLNVTGVSTFTSTVEITPSSDVKALVIDSTNATTDNNPQITLRGGGPNGIDFRDGANADGLKLVYRTSANQFKIENSENTTTHLRIDRDDGRVELSYGGDKKFETTDYGIYVTGAGNTSTIGGAANLVLDPSTVGDNTGTVTILGNLQVDGTQTIINSTTLEVDDKLVSIAKSATNATQADGAGLEINGASATLTYASTGDKWVFNKAPYYNSNRLLTTADEGTGSGLDADTVDGLEASQFLRSDAADTGTGLITLTNGLNVTGGNVGIGTDNPGEKLDVSGGDFIISNTNNYCIKTDLGVSGPKIQFGDRDLSQFDKFIEFGAYNNANNLDTKDRDFKLFSTAVDPILYAQEDTGNVGIGTDNPSQKLDVYGGSAAIRNIGGSSYIEVGAGQNSNQYAYIDFIGDTTYQDYGLRLLRGNGGVNSWSELIHRGTGTFYLSAQDAGSISLRTQNTDRVRITSAGNVGINSTAPTAKLDVNGDVSIASTVSIGTTIDIVPYNDLGALSFEGSAGQLFSITNNLTSGSIFSVNDVSGIPSIDVDADGTVLIAPYGSTEYVGIGTTNPTAKLDVNGTLNVSGVSTFGGNVNLGTDDKIIFGDSGNLEIFSGGSNSIIDQVGSGDLILRTTSSGDDIILRATDDVFIQVAGSENAIVCNSNASVDLYYNNSKKFETTADGIKVHPNVGLGTVAGNSQDLAIFETANSNGSKLRIVEERDINGTSWTSAYTRIQKTVDVTDQAYIQFNGSGLTYGLEIGNAANNEIYAQFRDNSSVDLYYNGSKKFETTDYGIYVTGAGNTSTIGGAANLVLDPSTVGDNTGTVTILGNLQVDGTQTIINSTTMTVDDLNITLASGAANAAAADGAGLTVDGASATLTYASTGDKWVFNKAPYYNTNRILTTADEGTGNGLDADTVDGIQASSFLRSDANDSATGLYSFAAGAYSANVTYGGRSITTNLDINSTSMRGGLLVRNANDYRSETDSASFMHYDAYNTSATSYAFRAAKGTTLADTFWVKGDGSGYFSGDVGIGITNPGAKLEVYGTSRFGGTVSVGRRVDIATDGLVTIAHGNNTNAPVLTLDNISDTGSTTGHGSNILWRFGINTSSTAAFNAGRISVLKEQQWTATTSTQNAYMTFDLVTNGNLSEKVRITSAGNLLINTTSATGTASQKLQVTGGAYVSGNLGVGATNPGYKLEVAGDIKLADTGTLWFDDTSGTIEKITATTSTLDYYSDSTHRFYESDNNAERATFDVNNASGRLYFDGDSNTYFTREATDCHVFVNAGSESLRINASGDVGINTTAPGSTLAVGGTITELYNGTYWNVVTQADVGYGASQVPLNQYLGQLAFLDDHHPNGLRRDGGGSDDVVVGAGGSVGIGTDSPTEKLDVRGHIRVTDENSNEGGEITFGAVSDGIRLFKGSSDNNFYLVQGTSSGNGLYLGSAGSVYVSLDTNNNDNDTKAFIVQKNALQTGTELFRVAESGNVGIGTDNPSTKLDVRGHIKVDEGPTLEDGGSSDLQVTTDYGYVRVGPVNTSYCHIQTDRTRFFFNKKLIVDEGIIASYNEDLALNTDINDERVRILSSNGYVGINTASPSYQLHVNGSFAATTKSFVIDHPTKDGMKLRYGSLEGPENGVYVRGRLKGNDTIELPDHWTGLVDEETITVNLTPIGRKAPLHSVVDIANNTVIVESANDVVDCFYTVFGERKDVEKLEVEF